MNIIRMVQSVVLCLLVTLSATLAAGELHRAVDNGNVRRARMLLEKNSSGINTKDANGCTPLGIAALREDVQMISLLLAHGADRTIPQDKFGSCALHYAAQSERHPVLAALLQGFDQVDIADRLGNTPIHVAAKCGNYEVVELLMKRHANIKAPNFKGSLPLHLAAETGQVAVIKLLCNSTKEANVLNSFGYSPLHYAAINDHLEAVRVLLHEGATAVINQKNKDGNTALHSAVMSGNVHIVRELLAAHAAVDIQNNENYTPLMLLALKPRIEHKAELCEMLLDARANHTISRAQFAQNAFALACMNGNQVVVRKLLVKRDIPVMEIQSGIFAAHISGHKQLASNLEKVLPIILDRQFSDMPPLEPIGS